MRLLDHPYACLVVGILTILVNLGLAFLDKHKDYTFGILGVICILISPQVRHLIARLLRATAAFLEHK